VEMGRITFVKKPKYDHKFTKEQYNKIQVDVDNKLDIIRNTLEKHQNKVKNRITDISLKDITRVFKYYFNTFTNAMNAENNRSFSKSYQEIKNIIMRALINVEETKKNMLEILENIKRKFVVQQKYIKNFQIDIENGKNKPNKKTFEYNYVKK
jgi:tRNA-dihydrouridine synthase